MQIKTINDYVDEVHEKFPQLPKESIKRILSFGWQSVYYHNQYGGDVLLADNMVNKFLFYMGELTYDSLKHFKYYIKKLIVKIRVKYNKAKTPWDGFYYFALTDDRYQEYLKQIHSKGRKRKKFSIPGNILIYKIFDECKVAEHDKKYFFKYKTGVDLGYKYLKKDLITETLEFIGEYESNGFKTLYR